MTPWMQTFTGAAWRVLDPDKNDVRMQDIAHALSMICRFGGHSRQFYSVAEHSIHVAYMLPPELRIHGLLHDAAEAYIGDHVSPIKHSLLVRTRNPRRWVTRPVAGPAGFEAMVLRRIYAGLHIKLPSKAERKRVKWCDAAALWNECRQVMGGDPWVWGLVDDGYQNFMVGHWPHGVAENLFIAAYGDCLNTINGVSKPLDQRLSELTGEQLYDPSNRHPPRYTGTSLSLRPMS